MKMIHNTSVGPIIVCDDCFKCTVKEAKRNHLPIDYEDISGKVPNHQTCDLCGASIDWIDVMTTSGTGVIYFNNVPFAEAKDIQINLGKNGPYNISDPGDKVP